MLVLVVLNRALLIVPAVNRDEKETVTRLLAVSMEQVAALPLIVTLHPAELCICISVARDSWRLPVMGNSWLGFTVKEKVDSMPVTALLLIMLKVWKAELLREE